MKWLSDALLASGALAISAGIGCIYWPAGVIAAGVFAVLGGAFIAYAGAKPMTSRKPNAA